ncbi:hypothetical protein [Rhizohabitans arisaemae]|uniref:hypothetical protein n=1 Tax=Rhizohabitans arisaemae TaxID=2720610 RepID=UPI0024B21647|nr:hypothetical protein [Rhizohabitans arisaemae]
MVALQIRDVPEDVRDALADTAKVRGMSLQGLLLELVTTEARRARNLAALDRARQITGKYDSRPGEAAAELAAARAEREAAWEDLP